MPARYVLDRGDWAVAAALSLTPSQYPMADSLTASRGLGMARTGNLAGAKAEIDAMKALRAALERVNDSYWADRTEEQMLAGPAGWRSRRRARPGGEVHACRRGQRRRQPQARRDGKPSLPAARAPRRHAV
jgi:hypothetical protein